MPGNNEILCVLWSMHERSKKSHCSSTLKAVHWSGLGVLWGCLLGACSWRFFIHSLLEKDPELICRDYINPLVWKLPWIDWTLLIFLDARNLSSGKWRMMCGIQSTVKEHLNAFFVKTKLSLSLLWALNVLFLDFGSCYFSVSCLCLNTFL